MKRIGPSVSAAILMSAGVAGSALGFAGEDVLDGQPWHHEDITERALTGRQTVRHREGAGFSPQAADAIAWHADYIDSYLYNPIFWAQDARESGARRLRAALVGYEDLMKLHFDDTFTTSGVRGNWERYAAGTLIGLDWAARQNDVAAAQHVLGVSLHAVQDFYSHSSWVSDPDRRCQTWLQTPVEERIAMPLFTGAYAQSAAGAPAHHGAYSLSCSILRGDDMDAMLDPVCSVVSPLQNAPFCESFRMCSGAEGANMSASGDIYEDVLFLEPPGIALDTTWLARVQAENRGLVNQYGNFAPGMDGMYFRPEECREIIRHSRPNTAGDEICDPDADQVFAGAKDLAMQASIEWALYLEDAMNAMGHGGFWSRVKSQGTAERLRYDQFEEFSQLPYQFLSAGPYPVGNASVLEQTSAESAAGWYLRMRIRTARTALAGTDSDVIARVRVGGADQDFRLDYLPTDDNEGRVSNPLLVYNDFESGANDAYMVGPFATQPESVTLVNDSGSSDEALTALWNDVVASVEETATSLRRASITLIAGKADYVGTASRHYTGAEVIGLLGDTESRSAFFEDSLRIDGGEQGVHELTYRIRPTPWLLTAQEREQGWVAMEVAARRFATVSESTVDRFSTSDEPFVIFHMAPLNGRPDQSGTFVSPPMQGMDSGEEISIARRTGSSQIIKVPPVGGLVLSARVFESDSENAYDRDQLRRDFASGLDEATRAAAPKFLDELGRLTAADWDAEQIQIYAFERSALPRAGEVLPAARVGLVRDDAASRTFALDWSGVRSLAAADFSIDSWQADPVKPRVLDGLWHASGHECDGPVAYDSVDVRLEENHLTATARTGNPCVEAGQVSWRGDYSDGIIDGEVYVGLPPENPEDTLPLYNDPAIDPNLALEGNWMVTWEDSDIPPAYATLTRGANFSCVDGASGCWYRFWRDPEAEWRVGYWAPGGFSNQGGLTFNADGAYSAEYGYYHLGYWGGTTQGRVAGPDSIAGEWTYGDQTGREVWTRVRSVVQQVEAPYAAAPQRAPVGGTLVTADAPYNPTPDMLRGNRPGITIRLYGEEMWGLHYYWLPEESGLEIDSMSYVCATRSEEDATAHSMDSVCLDQGGVLGVEFEITVWDWAKSGPQTMIFDGQEIAFNLRLDGEPAPTEPGWRHMRLAMQSCAVLQEVDAPDGVTPLQFTRADFRR